MRPHHSRIAAGALLTVLLTAAPAASQVDQRPVVAPLREGTQDTAVPAEVDRTFRRFAALWQSGDARAISHLVRDGRVHVVVQRDGIGARLSSGQLQYLLDEVFDASREVRLRFPSTVSYDPGTDSAWAVGERVYRDGPGLEPRTDRIFVGARNERGRWVLTELRLTP